MIHPHDPRFAAFRAEAIAKHNAWQEAIKQHGHDHELTKQAEDALVVAQAALAKARGAAMNP